MDKIISFFQNLNISQKLIYFITGTALAVIIVLALVQGTSGFSIAKTEALAKTEEMTERYSKEIGSELQYGMDTARSAAASLEALKETNNTDRKLASGILKEFLLRNPRILGTWVIYEGNAFDGKDAEHQKEP